ncbi:hypothetical protein BpHYR1_043429 [Brachionus plicatilis]|uniref:Uncharacterized protein n=1 Tax=Brachionus plicatilis TaxID=10195 RepID=A0A3M7R0Y6_BRAPC|nr:hypothetical protein BpHYR1_043429 [Brachionus plicatilis]
MVTPLETTKSFAKDNRRLISVFLIFWTFSFLIEDFVLLIKDAKKFRFFLFGLISGRECRIFESKKHFYCFKVCTELICHIISDTRSIASLMYLGKVPIYLDHYRLVA